MGAAGFAWSKDVSGWARTLFFIVLGCIVVAIVGVRRSITIDVAGSQGSRA
jgi:hypothetical protein